MRRSSAFLLALGIVAFFLANNANFFFRRPYYEFWDLAANSLSIERAKHFAQLYGPYSRYLFNHPGPAFFYVFAAGEALFYDTWHLVPSPFQGQLLLNLLLVTSLYVASLSMFASCLPARRRWIFVCAALVLGILHFGTMHNLSSLYDPLGGPSAFLSVWSGHSVVLPFLCLLTAGASVGAGRGRELPWMILAGGLLMEHISEAFAVGSVAVAAYLGLVARCAARPRAVAGGAEGPTPVRRRWWLAAWRDHPRAHLLAGLLLAVLLLPMALDLTLGRESNFAAILRHMHEERPDDRKPLVRSLAYFLQYGAYTPYQFNANYFGYYDRDGFLAYVRAHAAIYAAWGLVLLLLLPAPFAYLWALARRRAQPPADPTAADADALDTRRFLAWTTLVGALALVIALYWGTRQDGRMYYFNAYSNFAIYYFGALGAVAVLCTVGTARPAPADAPAVTAAAGRQWPVAPLVGAGVVILTAVLFAGHLRIHDDYGSADTRAMHRGVERAIAESNANHPDACKVLFVPDDHWPVSVGVGLQLARAGQPFVVTGARWKNTFGKQFDWHFLTPQTLRGGLCPWYVVSPGDLASGWPDSAPAIPLRKDAASIDAQLVLTPPRLELSAPGSTRALDFAMGGNAAQYTLGGMARPDPGGTWTEEPMPALAFLPQKVAGSSVEVTVQAMPFLSPAHGVTRQRMRLYFNGMRLEPEHEFTSARTVQFTIPAAVWNAAAGNAAPVASLAFDLPDAVVPATLDRSRPGGDPRDLAVFIARLELRVAP